MAAEHSPLLTPEEYLALERQGEGKHEYVAGEIVAMVGASFRHNLIQSDTQTSLNIQLRGTRCTVVGSDLRVKVASLGIYTYPDLTITCGEPQFEDSELDTLLNPSIVIEILSISTERYDRGLKFHRYQLIPSLREYLLIAQNKPRLDHYLRGPDNSWLPTTIEGLDGIVELPTVACTLALSDVYRQVDFG
jgi:Uma2 family endonuclease